MKTSKITNVQGNGSWQGDYGLMYSFEYTLENDNSFIAQVLNKVGNGQRFIFQPDNTNNNLDQFAICRIKKGSFSYSAKGHKLYNLKMEIVETW